MLHSGGIETSMSRGADTSAVSMKKMAMKEH